MPETTATTARVVALTANGTATTARVTVTANGTGTTGGGGSTETELARTGVNAANRLLAGLALLLLSAGMLLVARTARPQLMVHQPQRRA